MSKILAHGSTVSIGGDDIGGLTSLTTPERSRGEAETTDSDSGGTREFIPGLRESGTLELEFIRDYDDTGQQHLQSNYNGSAAEEVVITYPSDAASTSPVTLTFDAFVTEFPEDAPLADDEPFTATATLRVTGGVTEDLGS